MSVIVSPPVDVSGRVLVTVAVVLKDPSDRRSLGEALTEIDEWCDANGYHRPENWPNPIRQDGQFILVVGCVKN